jgi:hypothetical protein
VIELFARVYLDEDVDVLIATLLRSRGYEATTALEAGKLQLSDAEQLAFAAIAGFVILTHNRLHFESLAAECLADGRQHAGIIIAVRRPAYEIARRLLVLLNDISADEFRNQVFYV